MRRLYITSPIPLVDIVKTNISNIIEVSFEALNSLWSRFLNDLNTIAQSIFEALSMRRSQCIDRPECRARLLADSIASFIKHLIVVPLVPPPATKKALHIPHPQDIFLLYAILKGYCKYSSNDRIVCSLFEALDELLVGEHVTELSESMDKVREAVTSLNSIIGSNTFSLIFDPYSALEEEQTRVCRDENVYRLGLIRCIPADTRPGLNSSSLLVHALLTSALARLIFEHRAQAITNKDLAIEVVRLAALLHDVGKPLAWYETFTKGSYISHVSDTVLDRVWTSIGNFERLLGVDVWVYVRVLVKCHHSDNVVACVESEIKRLAPSAKPWPIGVIAEMAKAIVLADKISSAIDRVISSIESKRAEIEKLANVKWQDMADIFVHDERSWRWLIRADDSLVERIAKAVAQSIMSEPGVAGAGGEEAIEGVAIGVADVREIQRFINREDLRTLIGGSVAVDTTSLVIVPALVMKVLDLNIEHILYSGGGVVNFLLKSGSIKSVGEAYASISEKARWLPGVVFVESELLSDWRASARKLFTKLAVAKMLPPQSKLLSIHLTDLGVGIACELCGRGPAVEKVEPQKLLVCSVCKALRALGDNFYVQTKLGVLREVGYEVPSNNVSIVMKHLMEWLSGHERWSYGEGLNIAVLYADMNLGGLFFANSLSMSEAFTKSVLVDYALKKALYTALKAVKHTYGNDIASRCYAGILYAGGDDLLAIAPSTVAPLLVLYTALVFWSVIGSRQLSIAIASAKPRQNIWNIIDTAKKMLDEAKDFIRREAKSFEDLKTFAGVVTIIYSDRQLLPVYIEAAEAYRSTGMSSQPLILRVEPVDGFRFSKGFNSLISVLNLFSFREITGVRDLLDAVNQGKDVCIQASNEVEDFIREVYHMAKTHGTKAEDMPVRAAVYAVNYCIKVKNTEFGYKLRELLTSVISDFNKFVPKDSKSGLPGFFPLYDLYLMQKVLEGLKCLDKR
jgi:hypothetical protein